uniref:Uncharacterized protein n=1 Tax=Amphimedon queenslandica TaxID=400682 RepID=A0A1X7UKK0_AMPQE
MCALMLTSDILIVGNYLRYYVFQANLYYFIAFFKLYGPQELGTRFKMEKYEIDTFTHIGSMEVIKILEAD